MNILGTQFTLSNKSLDIYLAGCSGVNGHHCKNCHNPESWNFNAGELFTINKLNDVVNKIVEFNELIDNIMIFGGEPLDQPEKELLRLLVPISGLDKDIWIFTRKEIKEVPDSIKSICSYVKCGPYLEQFKTEDNIQYGIKLATSNQKIYKKGVDY